MLARLQQMMVATSVVVALAWLVWCREAGLGPGASAAGVALALLPQAPVLALEFVLLAAFGRDAAAPRASAAALVRAWLGEVLASWRVFNWHQPFFAGRQPDQPGPAGRSGVLLVHGYFCNRGLWLPWLRRLRALGVPCRALTIEPAFGHIDDWVPAIEAAVAALTRQTGRPPLLVAHSMGGLAVRAWLAAQSDADRADARVLRVVTIGTPHQGTWMARFGHTANARQMRTGGAWLAALAGGEAPARHGRFTCFYGHADNIVFPATTATLAGADNRHLPAVAHVAMLAHPQVWQVVQQHLR
jgi:triacylglycerol esterase/lipase EstA (alpha/beta hydrolase family)